MYKVALAGANGKMGQIAKQAITELTEFELVALITSADDIELELTRTKPDILIDVTRPEFAFEHAKLALMHKIKPIIGTSGLNEQAVLNLKAINQGVGAIIAPNFSISALLMLKFAEFAAPYFETIDIIEEHHQAKLDAPSGTAIKTAELCQTKSIHSIRRAGVIAKQSVIMANNSECLTIAQESLSRNSFIKGIQLACKSVILTTEVIYGLERFITGKNFANMV